MKIAIYTSFAVNYLAKARVMANSVKSFNADIDVVALVADRFPPDINPEDEPFDHIWMVEDYPRDDIRGWIFGHNIMELATAVKGWGLQRLLALGYDYVMYLDPDCWVLSDPAQIAEILSPGKSVAVVPHTTRPADNDEEIRVIETSSLKHGIYNLGFLLVKNDPNGNKLADWWASRLDRFCIDDFENGLFTDQRWFDLAVGYFDFVQISRHNGIDVASWNVGQRTLKRRPGGGYWINGDPLIFYHFSGVGPHGIHRWVREKFAPSDPLVSEMEFEYERLIEEQGQSRLVGVRPFFEGYSDGRPITRAHRRYYRSHPEIAAAFPDPYDVKSDSNFRAVAVSQDKSGEPPSEGVAETPADATTQPGDTDAQRLFDPIYYRSAQSLAGGDEELWSHYLAHGWADAVRPNRYFDPSHYAQFVSDRDRQSFKSPLHHYLAKGLAHGATPSWIYDDAWYLKQYPDIAEAVRANLFICGFEHFSSSGCREGRWGCGFFNEQAYLTRYPDIAEAVSKGVFPSGEEHYLTYGCLEGRQA